jgi:hypothetical protein
MPARHNSARARVRIFFMFGRLEWAVYGLKIIRLPANKKGKK